MVSSPRRALLWCLACVAATSALGRRSLATKSWRTGAPATSAHSRRRAPPPRRAALARLRGGYNTFDALIFLDFFGTAVFAFSGTIQAARNEMDIIFLTSVLTFCCWPRIERDLGGDDAHEAFCFADALGLGAFAVLSADIALKESCQPLCCVVFGLVGATFGGVMRDVLTKQPVRILHAHVHGRPKSLYGFTALVGALVYVALAPRFPDYPNCVAATGFLATAVLRVAAYTRSRSRVDRPHPGGPQAQLAPRARHAP
ncbi:hypothetical protein JL720_13600 [Aureococcus anophagefferens]|nr:hypothetical protein JL720_13600 [Aureococcus anophagefferens]